MVLVVVVDDEPAIRRFLKPSPTAEGYRVVQAMTGGEALRLAAGHHRARPAGRHS